MKFWFKLKLPTLPIFQSQIRFGVKERSLNLFFLAVTSMFKLMKFIRLDVCQSHVR